MNGYQQLLEATIAHLEELRHRGQSWVLVKPETLAALARPAVAAPRRPAAAPALPPAPSASPAPPKPSLPPGTLGFVTAPKPPAAPPSAAPAPGPKPVPVEAGDRELALASLRARVLACVKCPHLVRSRRTVVFGVGNLYADLMFVGEAPGADEDAQGEPFVGAAGQLLTKMIQTMGLRREEVFIANVLKCRPDTPGQTSGNRKPTPQEMVTCLPWLQQQIDLIRPKVLVALGATALEGLTQQRVSITKERGVWRDYRGIPLMPTYHPAYLLRNQSLAAKRQVWEDLLQVMEKLGLPISEKQRQYFLKK
ncbi:MAG: uracil-DNA glycosylase [Verrucomicrobiae bacterium]|nr:uracil-DNA glycosylase [Verrucomicrobiae bacterium]